MDSGMRQLRFTPAPHYLAVQYQTRVSSSRGLDCSTHRIGESLEARNKRGHLRGKKNNSVFSSSPSRLVLVPENRTAPKAAESP